MWASLNCGRPAFAVWATSGRAWIWPVVVNLIVNLYNLRFLGRGLYTFPTGSPLEVVLASIFAGVWLWIWLLKFFIIDRSPNAHDFKWDNEAMVFVQRRPGFERGFGNCEERLIREFREIVREPLPDPSDPRFKRWRVQERFPWGWQIAQHQLLERLGRKSVEATELWKSREPWK
jgi:hypothetical protein